MAQKPRLFISHSSTDIIAAKALQAALVPHFSVFLDAVNLRPGDSWQEKIEEELLHCDCAVVMFSREVIDNSHWVQAEAYVFSLRLRMRDSDFRMVPLLLGDVKNADLNAPQLAKARLAAVQAVKMSDATAAAALIVEGLDSVLKQYHALAPFREVAIAVADRIKEEIGDNALDLLVPYLGLEPFDLQLAKARSRWIAAGLLRCSLKQLVQFYRRLVAIDEKYADVGRRIFRRVAPYAWVDRGAATAMAAAALETPKPPLAMNATRSLTPRMYVRRASVGIPEWSALDCDGDFGEANVTSGAVPEATVDQMIIRNVKRTLARDLNLPLDPEPSVDQINEELQGYRPDEPVFVLLPPWAAEMGPKLLERIGPVFPAVVYLVRTERPTPSVQKLASQLRCLPVLDAKIEEDVYLQYGRCIPTGAPFL